MRDRTLSWPMHRSIRPFLRNKLFRPIALITILLFAVGVSAQTQTPAQTPFLFALAPLTLNSDGSVNTEGMVTLLRDPSSGVLTLLPAAPTAFPHLCQPEAMEPQGQFLLGVCGNGLAMYSFNSTTGAVLELPNSPWAESSIGYPFLVAPESTGQFVYLLKFLEPPGGGSPISYILDTFFIDRTASQLVPQSTQTLSFTNPGPVAVADPNGHGIAFLGTQTSSIGAPSILTLYTIAFDPLTGLATIPTSGTTLPGTTSYAHASSPQGNFIAFSLDSLPNYQSGQPYVTVVTMSSTTFEVIGSPVTISNAINGSPPFATGFLSFDPLGGLLYDQVPPLTPPPSGDGYPFAVLQAPSLTYVDTLPWDPAQLAFGGVPDPDGPFRYERLYSTPPLGINVYLVDPATGFLIPTAALANPFYPSMNIEPIFANYVAAGSGQALSGPFLSQSTGSLIFPQTTAGQNSAPQTIILKSVGAQSVTISSITSSGSNVPDFVLSGNCLTTPLLASQASCALTVTYAPATAGTSTATITISGNSPTSPQLISLSGTATAPPTPAPVVSFNSANPYTFPGTITQGTSSSPQNIVLSNPGNAPLHISGVALGGYNLGDYSIGSSNCSGTIAASSSCTIPLTFSPLGSGVRSATLTVSDDAANSPQVLTINGNAIPSASIPAPAPVSVTAGQQAQFNLTATPGNGFSGTLTFACSGAPFGTTCTVPQSISLTNGVATSFKITVATGSSAAFLPAPFAPPNLPTIPYPLAMFETLAAILTFLIAMILSGRRSAPIHPLRWAALVFLLAMLLAPGIGCGGGGAGSPQPSPTLQAAATPVIAPNGGTFTTAFPSITITDATPGATIHYTTDGSTPTSSSAVYSGAFTLSAPGNLQAIAIASGFSASPIASATFNAQAAAGSYTLTISPTAQSIGSAKQLQMNSIQLTLNVN
jgi:hypothetical protein